MTSPGPSPTETPLPPTPDRRRRPVPSGLRFLVNGLLLAVAAGAAGRATLGDDRLAVAITVGAVLLLLAWLLAASAELRGRLHAAEARLAEAAVFDDVTGLASRRLALARLAEEAARARRYGRALAVLRLDVDGLAAVNQRHGRAGGDEALRAVGEAVRVRCRRSDLVARWEGSGFVAVLPETGGDGARVIAARLREAVAARTTALAGRVVSITASFGVAILPEGAGDAGPGPEALLAEAEAALARAKAAGGNAVDGGPPA